MVDTSTPIPAFPHQRGKELIFSLPLHPSLLTSLPRGERKLEPPFSFREKGGNEGTGGLGWGCDVTLLNLQAYTENQYDRRSYVAILPFNDVSESGAR
jgi:hypothetical protein